MNYQFSQGKINYNIPNQVQARHPNQNNQGSNLYTSASDRKPVTSINFSNNSNVNQNINQTQNIQRSFTYTPAQGSYLNTQSSTQLNSSQKIPRSTLINEVTQDLQKLKLQLKTMEENPIKQTDITKEKLSLQFSSPENFNKSKIQSSSNLPTPYQNLKNQSQILKSSRKQRDEETNNIYLDYIYMKQENLKLKQQLQEIKQSRQIPLNKTENNENNLIQHQLNRKISQQQQTIKKLNKQIIQNTSRNEINLYKKQIDYQKNQNMALNQEINNVKQLNTKLKENYEIEKQKKYQILKNSEFQIKNLKQLSNSLRNKIATLEQKNSELKNQNEKLQEQKLKYQKKISSQSNDNQEHKNILKTEETKPLKSHEQIDFEMRIQVLNEQIKFYKSYTEKMQIMEYKIEEYEQKIKKLQAENNSPAKDLKNKSSGQFNDILRDQLIESLKFKQNIKVKNEEIFNLNEQILFQKSNSENLKRDLEIEKYKAQNEKKNLQLMFDAQKQNYLNEISSLKNSISQLQQKLKQLAVEHNKKDEFMRSYLQGRVKSQQDREFIENFFKDYELIIPKSSLLKIWNKQQLQIKRLQNELKQLQDKYQYEQKIKQRIIYR